MATRTLAASLVIAVALCGCVLDWQGSRPGRDGAADLRPSLEGGAGEGAADAPPDAPPDAPGFDVKLDGPGEGGLDADHGAGLDAAGDAAGDAVAPDAASKSTCTAPSQLTLGSGGSITVTGTTSGQTNDFGTQITCNSGYDLDGPQVYYTIALKAATSYLLTLTTPKHNGALYIFKDQTCTPALITAQCAGGGDGGYAESGYGYPEKLLFTPTSAGDYIIAVDSILPAGHGAFSLKIEQVNLPSNGICTKAQQLTLGSGGKVTVSGDTGLAVNEFAALQCKLAGTGVITKKLAGPQLYYTWAALKDQWYKLSLSPVDSDQYLYVFEGGACTAAAINAGCQVGGAGGQALLVSKGAPRALYYRASQPGAAYFAVDSTGAGSGFTATLEAIQAPQNTTCAAPQALTLSGGKVVVSGDTAPIMTPDEFPTLQCVATATYDGPQVYYDVGLTGGVAYLLSLTADAATSLVAYLFSGACTPAAIHWDCSSKGASGAVTSEAVSSGSIALASFKPQTTATYKVGVDSPYVDAFGGFTLAISEIKPPANDTCATAQTIALSGGKATLSAVKAGATNTLGLCGTKQITAADLWYKLASTPGKSYTVTFAPHPPGGRFAVFGGNHGCVTSKLVSACGTYGSTFVNGGGSASRTITATGSLVHILVDGYDPGYDLYAFELAVKEGL